eukprot:gene51-646_t
MQSVDSEIRFRSPVPPRERRPESGIRNPVPPRELRSESGFRSSVPPRERRPESGKRSPVPPREPRSEMSDTGRDALNGSTQMMRRTDVRSPNPAAPLWRRTVDDKAMTHMPLAPGPYDLQTSGAQSTMQWPWATPIASHGGTNMATRPLMMTTLSRPGATMEQSSHLSEAEGDRAIAKCLLQRTIASIDWQEEDTERLQQKQEALRRANARLEEATTELERQQKVAGLSVAERLQRLVEFEEDSSRATTAMRRMKKLLNRGEKQTEKNGESSREMWSKRQESAGRR